MGGSATTSATADTHAGVGLGHTQTDRQTDTDTDTAAIDTGHQPCPALWKREDNSLFLCSINVSEGSSKCNSINGRQRLQHCVKCGHKQARVSKRQLVHALPLLVGQSQHAALYAGG